MFEKEAEEYTKNIFCNVNCSIGHPRARSVNLLDVEQAFQDGAEFGYNKANEWHYVKDGINPTHPYRVLVFTDEGVGFGIYGLDDKKWHTYDTGFEVIAWKEIVLPELKEGE